MAILPQIFLFSEVEEKNPEVMRNASCCCIKGEAREQSSGESEEHRRLLPLKRLPVCEGGA
jgi:hypothetical protein